MFGWEVFALLIVTGPAIAFALEWRRDDDQCLVDLRPAYYHAVFLSTSVGLR